MKPLYTTVGAGFDKDTRDAIGVRNLGTELVAGAVLSEIADSRNDICVMTADLGGPTRVEEFGIKHPERYFNFGIAERNMVSSAAGITTTGVRPYVAGYSFFLGIIAAEQIRTDICYPNLPVRMLGTNSGIAMGFYGTSHHATEDIAILRSMAGLTLLAPVDGVTLRQSLEATVDHAGPIYFRLGRGRDPAVYGTPIENWRIGGSNCLHEGSDAAIFATGTCVAAALRAAQILSAEGISIRVVDVYSIKPLDRDAVISAARETTALFTAEEHNIIGGLGSAVSEVIAEEGLGVRVVRLGIPDQYSLLGPPTHLYRHYGINAEGIAKSAREHIKRRP